MRIQNMTAYSHLSPKNYTKGNTVIVNNVTSDISGLLEYGQVIHGRRYRWLISYMTHHSGGTPTNIRMYFIFLENRSIGLHSAADNIGLSSLKFFW